ncbi:CybS-domain-containing protein, partial [Piptocephalis cylindrospora]
PVDRFHGSYHWDYERLLALSLVPLTATVAIQGSGNPTTDLILGVLMPLHCHVGFDACIVDYLPERKSPKLYKFSLWALRLSTIGVLYGCYEFNTNDIGLTELVTRAWT